jgi:hypothetical protein
VKPMFGAARSTRSTTRTAPRSTVKAPERDEADDEGDEAERDEADQEGGDADDDAR